MKQTHRFIAAALIAVMLSLSLPVLSLAAVPVRSDPGTAEYNFFDVLSVMFFLESEDESGVKNGTKMFGSNYDMGDPETWTVLLGEDGDYYYQGFFFEEVEGELRLTTVLCGEFDLVGWLTLDGCSELLLVDCSYNKLNSVSVLDCPKLETLNMQDNKNITELDVSECPALNWLQCYYCGITELDLTYNPELEFLEMEGNPVGTLDLSSCPKLWYLMCENCGLTELDLSNNPDLMFLNCGLNDISALDLSKNTKLLSLNCDLTLLTELDVSACVRLAQLQCVYNDIKDLDLRNNDLMLDKISAEGHGSIGCAIGSEWDGSSYFVDAYPEDGFDFLGWYDEQGDLLSTAARWYLTDGDFGTVIARFTGADEPGPGPEPTPVIGDVDGDGEVTLVDALIILRAAMGLVELTPEQEALADFNGDGTVNSEDALLVMRLAMGL
ncbi:MAG: hypothetical protein IKQ36_10500 [Clostridia bacterium]|nr:hypothetical protein [Clostridia bacterium]